MDEWTSGRVDSLSFSRSFFPSVSSELLRDRLLMKGDVSLSMGTEVRSVREERERERERVSEWWTNSVTSKNLTKYELPETPVFHVTSLQLLSDFFLTSDTVMIAVMILDPEVQYHPRRLLVSGWCSVML